MDPPQEKTESLLRQARQEEFQREIEYYERQPLRPTAESLRYNDRQRQRAEAHAASEPHNQFHAQIREETRRMYEADPLIRSENLFGPEATAYEVVKKRWIEQGIWGKDWPYDFRGPWEHEIPLKLEGESESETEAESTILFFPKKPPRRIKSDEEKRQIAEQRAVKLREHEATRPYHQFVYQVSKERERSKEESLSSDGADADDINTRAYETVKNTWLKRGIWKSSWGTLPGMSWQHEEPFEREVLREASKPSELFRAGGKTSFAIGMPRRQS